MADISKGPGWWLASDGKWYPPELAPGAPARADTSTTMPHPVSVDLSGTGKVANWRALVHIVMAIPHYIVNYILNLLRQVLWLISFVTVLFAARVPDTIRDIQMMALRYNNRFMSFVLLLDEQYPPFDFTATPTDPGGYPLTTSFQPIDRLSRWRCLQPLLLVPHLIVLTFLFVGAVAAYVAGWFSVVFTGRQPAGISTFLVGVGRWTTRTLAYGLYLTDQYPPFSLD